MARKPDPQSPAAAPAADTTVTAPYDPRQRPEIVAKRIAHGKLKAPAPVPPAPDAAAE